MVVNGRAWPYLNVEQRRYRFRVLNGCNTRFLILTLSRAGFPFWQIGSDSGFLPRPVPLERLLLAPAERADVIVDFTDVPVGSEIVLQNRGPDEPFGGGEPDSDCDAADAPTTRQVMQFPVVPSRSRDLSIPPPRLVLPIAPALPPESVTRHLSVNELESATVLVDTPMGHGHRRRQPSRVAFACHDPRAVPFGPIQACLAR